MKAYLIFNGADFGKTHNLEYLLEMCSKFDKEFHKIDAGNLSFYAVEVRYPDNFYIPTFKEAVTSVKIARQVKKFILKKLH